jgi:hypothetical protein
MDYLHNTLESVQGIARVYRVVHYLNRIPGRLAPPLAVLPVGCTPSSDELIDNDELDRIKYVVAPFLREIRMAKLNYRRTGIPDDIFARIPLSS